VQTLFFGVAYLLQRLWVGQPVFNRNVLKITHNILALAEVAV
jgi:hypothetical protein